MSVDLTQFRPGDEILVEYRGVVVDDEPGVPGRQVAIGESYVPLVRAVSARLVPPVIEPERRYVDRHGNLYIGGTDGALVGPITSNERGSCVWPKNGSAWPAGLRPAVLHPVVPA